MYRGTFKTGTASHTQGQRKWHASQLSKGTLGAIRSRLRQTIRQRGWRLSYHIRKKDDLTFSPRTIQRAINAGDIIEYNETPGRDGTSRRVLLRDSRHSYKVRTNVGVTESNLCVVVDIDDGSVITAYWNDANDNHNTMNPRRYESAPLRFAACTV